MEGITSGFKTLWNSIKSN
ncbi:hypothetical protein EBR43_06680 [bacterium]|nr:hypothetical protein [bacterium]